MVWSRLNGLHDVKPLGGKRTVFHLTMEQAVRFLFLCLYWSHIIIFYGY